MPYRFFNSLRFLNPKNKKDYRLYLRLKLMLGFYPENINLYKQAFRHGSVAKQIKQGFRNDNERLEYLGDAVLSTIIAEYLFQQYPFKNEGFLTQLRSRIVNRTQLNKIALKIGLDELLEIDSKSISSRFTLSGNAFEALIGAIFLDKGYAAAKQFIVERILKFHIDINDLENSDPDFKSQLINFCQKEKLKYNFTVIKSPETDSNSNFEVQIEINEVIYAAFQHPSKRKAEQFAAQLAFEKLVK